jgi:hypothetical protein
MRHELRLRHADTGGTLHVVMDRRAPQSPPTQFWLRVNLGQCLRAYLHCFQGFDGDILPALVLARKTRPCVPRMRCTISKLSSGASLPGSLACQRRGRAEAVLLSMAHNALLHPQQRPSRYWHRQSYVFIRHIIDNSACACSHHLTNEHSTTISIINSYRLGIETEATSLVRVSPMSRIAMLRAGKIALLCNERVSGVATRGFHVSASACVRCQRQLHQSLRCNTILWKGFESIHHNFISQTRSTLPPFQPHLPVQNQTNSQSSSRFSVESVHPQCKSPADHLVYSATPLSRPGTLSRSCSDHSRSATAEGRRCFSREPVQPPGMHPDSFGAHNLRLRINIAEAAQ